MNASSRFDVTIWSARLALVNSTGYSATTILPLWIAALPSSLAVPSDQIGLVGTLQLVTCGIFCFAAPLISGRHSPLPAARLSLAVSAVGCLGAGASLAWGSFVLFALFSLLIGAGFGMLLAMTNRIVAVSDHVQHGYAIFQIVEVCFASALFLAGSKLVNEVHGGGLFLTLAAICLLALLTLHRLPGGKSASRQPDLPRLGGLSIQGVVMLVAMLCFFIGQSSINSYLIPIGVRSGWNAETVAHIVAAGMLFALGGATAARLVGDRFGIARPIGVVGLLLALDFILLTADLSPEAFAVGAMFVSSGTIFVVPYFFTSLARADTDGHHASLGPVFLIGGVSFGPLLATSLTQNGDYGRLGGVGASFVVLAVIMTLANSWASRARIVSVV